MKDMKRATRRHHIARLKKHRASYFVVSWWDDQYKAKRLGRIVQYPKMCSCASCGNPRKWDKQERTIRELQHFDIMADGLKDLYEPD